MSTPTRIAVVGAGLVGIRHIDAIKQAANIELAAIVDTSEEARQLAHETQVNFYGAVKEINYSTCLCINSG